jgi:hypothetical protein
MDQFDPFDSFDTFNHLDHLDPFFSPLPASLAPELAQTSQLALEPEMSLPPPIIYPTKEALFEAI